MFAPHRSNSPFARTHFALIVSALLTLTSGCAVHVYESRTITHSSETSKTTEQPPTAPAAPAAATAESASQASPRRPADQSELAAYIREHYDKSIHQIRMRDGVKLYTIVYAPKDASPDRTYPILMIRTPYAIGPYEPDRYRESLGPSADYARDGYIFVYQDVRGCYMSEGTFVNMTPHVAVKTSDADIDESTDTWDSIEWLVNTIPHNNGRVGLYGISYPGFYAAASMIDAHPALKASSPQAPIADWWYDDFHHHGALFLPHSFNFLSGFGRERPEPTTSRPGRLVSHGTPDGYQFFLDMGPIHNANDTYFKNQIAFWNDLCNHPNYDEFWQARSILPHLNNCAPAVMTVGGWFDAEDLYGPLKIYQSVEQRNPDSFNILVMGPWVHGGWNRGDGDRLGAILFGDKHSLMYREKIERPFFAHHLKDEPDPQLPDAYIFETGGNRWHAFDQWPPAHAIERALHAGPDGSLAWNAPEQHGDAATYDEFISDPARPVPFTEAISIGMSREYMIDDQRFASRRPDVVVYQTPPLDNDVTIAGEVLADLWVSTSGTDSDWIVKLIDVFPADTPNNEHTPPGRAMGGYQMMVRSEVIRGRFRNSYERPEPFTPDQPTFVHLPLQDVLHTFKKGHRIMIHVQSTWFPLVDRCPHTYVENIYTDARESDFIKAVQRVHRSPEHQTRFRVRTLELD